MPVHTPACEDVIDLANGDGLQTTALDHIQQGLLGRLQRVIVTIGGSLICTGSTNKGTGNDTADAMLSDEHLSCGMAVLVQLFDGDYFLMGCDLEHRVCGGVDDQIAGFHMLVTILLDNFRT